VIVRIDAVVARLDRIVEARDAARAAGPEVDHEDRFSSPDQGYPCGQGSAAPKEARP
jgi:hypothetical protein